jgi:predicted HTH transcriptional regulator
MKTLLILLSGVVIGFVITWVWRRVLGRSEGENRGRNCEGSQEKVVIKSENRGTKLSRELSEKKKENLAKIDDYLIAHDRVTNDDIEKLLSVSNATAYRYLEELENKGVLKQVGKTGTAVYYEKVSQTSQ